MTKKHAPEVWTKADSEQAIGQGWDLYTAYERDQFEYVIQRDDTPKIFLTDEAAREFVVTRGKAGDALAVKALKLVFVSRCGVMPV